MTATSLLFLLTFSSSSSSSGLLLLLLCASHQGQPGGWVATRPDIAVRSRSKARKLLLTQEELSSRMGLDPTRNIGGISLRPPHPRNEKTFLLPFISFHLIFQLFLTHQGKFPAIKQKVFFFSFKPALLVGCAGGPLLEPS